MKLLNEAREKTEEIIDTLDLRDKKGNKVRTYRRKARRIFTGYSKNCKKNKKGQTRNQIKKQLGFVRRNLANIEKYATVDKIFTLSKKQLHDLVAIIKVFGQQKEMFDNKKHICDDRIVNISQDWVRPIIRGKAGANVEFGIKTTFCEICGMTYVGKRSFDNYNEGKTLEEIAEQYKTYFGFYPEEILGDKIYHNKENREFCEKHHIRFVGQKLGRPPKNEEKLKKQRKDEYKAMCKRIEIEGRFGVGKRKYGLDLIKMKKKNSTMTIISLIAMILNA